MYLLIIKKIKLINLNKGHTNQRMDVVGTEK